MSLWDCNILTKQMLSLWVDTEWLGPGRWYGGAPPASRAAAIHAHHPDFHRAGTSNY